MSETHAEHRQAYAYCAFCPKMCRFACPVSDSTKTESTSTWGKMSEAYLVTQKSKPLDESGAKALYACTGCMRCRSFCKHDNEVGYALFSARSVAVSQDLAPKGAATTLATFAEHQNPFGRDLGEAVAKYRADAPVRFPLWPGCSALVKRPEAVADAVAVGEALGAPLGVSRASTRCCGYPLYAAGDADGFRAHAARIADALTGYPELVVLDPGCAYTFKVVYPRFGVELKTHVRTAYEVLDAHLPHAPKKPKLPARAAYHDACHLGRGLEQYDEPRRLLAAAVTETVELREAREEGGCSGGGGLLPRTMPETSVDVARRQADNVAEADLIVSACPTSSRMFERAGRKAEDLISVLRRWLSQT